VITWVLYQTNSLSCILLSNGPQKNENGRISSYNVSPNTNPVFELVK